MALETDPVSLSDLCQWLVDYYERHGQTAEATRLADRAAIGRDGATAAAGDHEETEDQARAGHARVRCGPNAARSRTASPLSSGAPTARYSPAMRLGIDLGTTRTVVAAVQDGKYPPASFDADGAIR